jgi:hypothetical protein
MCGTFHVGTHRYCLPPPLNSGHTYPWPQKILLSFRLENGPFPQSLRQSADFHDIAKNCSFPDRKRHLCNPEFPDGHKIEKLSTKYNWTFGTPAVFCTSKNRGFPSHPRDWFGFDSDQQLQHTNSENKICKPDHLCQEKNRTTYYDSLLWCFKLVEVAEKEGKALEKLITKKFGKHEKYWCFVKNPGG